MKNLCLLGCLLKKYPLKQSKRMEVVYLAMNGEASRHRRATGGWGEWSLVGGAWWVRTQEELGEAGEEGGQGPQEGPCLLGCAFTTEVFTMKVKPQRLSKREDGI